MVDHPEAQNIGCKEGQGNFETSIKEFPDPPRTVLFLVDQWISESVRYGGGRSAPSRLQKSKVGVMTDAGKWWSIT